MMEKEKNVMRSIINKVLIACMVLVLATGINVVVTGQDDQVQAAGKKKDALKAYKKMLSKSQIEWDKKSEMHLSSAYKFIIKDIDGNKVPELILNCDAATATEGYERIYTYSNGAVKELLVASYGYFRIYPKKHVVTIGMARSGTYFDGWYKISKGKVKLVAYREGKDSFTNGNYKIFYYEYEVNGKKATKKKYTKTIKKLKTKEMKKNYIDNTKANRNKYLK